MLSTHDKAINSEGHTGSIIGYTVKSGMPIVYKVRYDRNPNEVVKVKEGQLFKLQGQRVLG